MRIAGLRSRRRPVSTERAGPLLIQHSSGDFNMIIELGNVSEETQDMGPIGGQDDKRYSFI
jgi:hypothetical protein